MKNKSPIQLDPSYYWKYWHEKMRKYVGYEVVKPAELLYHYTNSHGLIGILDSNSIYMTHVGHMNDSNELLYSNNVTHEVFNGIERDYKEKWVYAVNDLKLINYSEINRAGRFAVACFCENGDLLSQWRGYSNGGQGYSIGLKTKIFIDEVPNITKFPMLIKIVYDKKIQYEIVDLSLRLLLGCYDQDKNFVENDIRDFAFKEIYKQLVNFFTVAFKDPAFTEENEWRYVQLFSNNSDFKTRERNGNIILYHPLKLPLISDWLSEIVCGPGINYEISKTSLAVKIDNRNDKYSIKKSRIPLV